MLSLHDTREMCSMTTAGLRPVAGFAGADVQKPRYQVIPVADGRACTP